MPLVDGAVVCFGAAGEAADVVVGLLDLNQECLAGVGETEAGAGDVATVVGVAAFFLECLGLATLAEGSGFAAGDGDWASNEVAENPINVISRPINLFIPKPYRRGQCGCKSKIMQAGDSSARKACKLNTSAGEAVDLIKGRLGGIFGSNA